MNTSIISWQPPDKPHKLGVFDLALFILIGLMIQGIVLSASRWTTQLNPNTPISHSIKDLPLYATYSLFRALMAYGLSLVFSLLCGYWAAKSTKAARIILPLLDIGQSIPVLGFLPGLVLGFIAIFPRSNIGLELACILMIFTGQVWNMTFGFYASLKVIPDAYFELSKILRLSAWQRFFRLELPFSAPNLAWNSMMSMAGGWFFLTICEAFTLSGQHFRLPGLGSFMAQAIEMGDSSAMACGICAMVTVIVSMDFLLWRPLVAWTYGFHAEDRPLAPRPFPLMFTLLKNSWTLRVAGTITHNFAKALRHGPHRNLGAITSVWRTLLDLSHRKQLSYVLRFLGTCLTFSIGLWALLHTSDLVRFLTMLTRDEVRLIALGTGATLARVLSALIMATVWTVPIGLWIGLSPQRTQFFEPLVQVAASFPAPMLYPLALAAFTALDVSFGMGSTYLILLGVQWYILFNVLAGAAAMPQELRDTFRLTKASTWSTWLSLYLPAIFPSLVTGWMTAAGGAWNASIVAEYMDYKGKTLSTLGLGALINTATSQGRFPLLVGALIAMVLVVVSLNHLVWQRLYGIASSRFRLEN